MTPRALDSYSQQIWGNNLSEERGRSRDAGAPVRALVEHRTGASRSGVIMAGDYPYSKFVSPAKCIERPWDLWVSELGHNSPRPDDGAFVVPAPADSKGGASRRVHEGHPYKAGERRYRRGGLHRLKNESMPLHGLFPQLDNLNVAVCHMCGVIVKCSAAYRHLVESHAGCEPLLPPPPPVATVRNRSRHKKDQQPPPSPVERLPVKLSSPVHTAAAPLSRLVLPQQELQYLEEPGPSTAVTGEVQVCVESGELPVVSIQDTEELPLGENLTDDIFDIMNSEGIQSADDITNATDWKNIIRDIGNLQDINFSQTTDSVQTQDLFAPAMQAAPSYTISDDLSTLHFANTSPLLPAGADTVHTPHTPQALKPPATPSTPKSQRSKTSKTTKFNLREYDANKHCGVMTAEGKPCTRSLTCKAHALSLRRMVEGRAKPFDTLLAEHRASREAAALSAAPAPPPPPIIDLPPLLVNNAIDLSAFNGLTTEQQVNDIYSLLSVDDPHSLLADPSAITSLLNQPMTDTYVMPEGIPAVPVQPSPVERIERPERIDRTERTERIDRHERTERHERTDRHERMERSERPDRSERTSSSSRTRDDTPAVVAGDVCWYASCPRPLAVCTFNAAHAGGAITLGKKFATVRSNIKSSLSRSQCKSTGSTNNFFYGQSAFSLSKSVHMNASKTNKPEVRRLIVCSGSSASGKEVHQTYEIFGGEPRPTLNGHLGHLGHGTNKIRAPIKQSKHSATPVLDLGFSLDPLLADEKC